MAVQAARGGSHRRPGPLPQRRHGLGRLLADLAHHAVERPQPFLHLLGDLGPGLLRRPGMERRLRVVLHRELASSWRCPRRGAWPGAPGRSPAPPSRRRPVTRLRSTTTRASTGVAPNSGRYSRHAQWLVALYPRMSPAAPSRSEPEQTEVTYLAREPRSARKPMTSESVMMPNWPGPPPTKIASRSFGQSANVAGGPQPDPRVRLDEVARLPDRGGRCTRWTGPSAGRAGPAA